ncbi:MAG: 50S ribosomal protein L25 [Candidatus Omnitrophota bacterium]
MEEVKLEVQVRNEVGSQKIKAVRRNEDMIPGIVYGGGDGASVIKFDRRTYEKARRLHHGEILFHINIMKGKEKAQDYSAVVKEEQRDFVTGNVIHVDFKRISLKEKIEVNVPLVPSGTPIGVKNSGGALEHNLWELDITCLPTDIPEEIRVDVSALNIGDVLHVKDIQLPAGVVTEHDPETVVFSVAAPMRVEEVTEAPASTEPELIKKAKPEAAAEGAKPEKTA